MKRSNDLYIADILEAIRDIEVFTKDLTEEEFFRKKKEQLALIKSLEIIGEASIQIEKKFKDLNPQFPWHILKGLRNILIHDYSGVDLEIIWDIIKNDLPLLKVQVEEIAKSLK